MFMFSKREEGEEEEEMEEGERGEEKREREDAEEKLNTMRNSNPQGWRVVVRRRAEAKASHSGFSYFGASLKLLSIIIMLLPLCKCFRYLSVRGAACSRGPHHLDAHSSSAPS